MLEEGIWDIPHETLHRIAERMMQTLGALRKKILRGEQQHRTGVKSLRTKLINFTNLS